MAADSEQSLIKYPLMRVFFVALLFCSNTLNAAEIRVAVASNFRYTLQKLALDFKEKTGHVLHISAGSSGKLYAQIKYGAPFDVFLSADERRADLLVDEDIAARESAYIYARGKLVLLSNIKTEGDCKAILSSERLHKLAIANPGIAPYGLAARQVLEALDLWGRLRPRLVMGENVAQAMQFVSTQNAEAGFVAEALLYAAGSTSGQADTDSCLWYVPPDMYSAINQKMVVINKAKKKLPVLAFARYMQSAGAKEIIRASGYNVLH